MDELDVARKSFRQTLRKLLDTVNKRAKANLPISNNDDSSRSNSTLLDKEVEGIAKDLLGVLSPYATANSVGEKQGFNKELYNFDKTVRDTVKSDEEETRLRFEIESKRAQIQALQDALNK